MSNWKPTSGPSGPMIVDRECTRCAGSGEIVVRNTFPMSEVGPGPVPDWASNVTGSKCPDCDGTGAVEYDLNEDVEDWME